MAEGRRERVKEKVRAAGLDALAPHEIIEFLLYPFIPRKDTSPLARALLEEFVSLDGILNAKEQDLQKVPGMPKSAALYFPVYSKVVGKARSEFMIKRHELVNIHEAEIFLIELLGLNPTEELHMLCLDSKRRIIKSKKISEGSAVNTDVNMRLIAETALKTNAAYIILGHNHPSGEIEPSNEDLVCTAAAQKLLKSLNVGLLDHIIVGKQTAYSMRLEGCLANIEKL
jgi:DNA repair protein RadC